MGLSVAAYFIHIEDPQFREYPFPGERRLGPYDDDPVSGVSGLDSATNQAVSDAAQGMGIPLGVYAEEESEKRMGVAPLEEGDQADLHIGEVPHKFVAVRGKAAKTRSHIARLANTRRKEMAAEREAQAQARLDDLTHQYQPLSETE